MNSGIYWYIIFFILLAAYLIIQFTVKAKRKYFLYFASGAVLGFYFDIVSFTQGYYSYPDFFIFKIFGLPLCMTLAEGFSVAITIYAIEFLRKCFETKSISLKNFP